MGSSADVSMRTLFHQSSASPDYHVSDLEQKYMDLIQYQIQPYFSRFAAALAEQSSFEREQGRCAVLDFTDPGCPQSTVFKSSVHLERFLDESLSTQQRVSREGPVRRVFILEDLPCNHLLTLGSRLRIPPSFFAGHWDDPATPSRFNHRNSFGRSSRSQFRLRYATSNRVEVDTPAPAGMYGFNTNVCRYLHTYTPNGLVHDEARSHHTLSFWSSVPREDGSWDAVLLVDPPPQNFVRCLATGTRILLLNRLRDETSMPKHFLNPEIDVLQELAANPLDWAAAYTSPEYASMFDDTIRLLTATETKSTSLDDPILVTELPRKLVMSTLIAFIRRRYLNLIGVQQSQLKPHYALRHNYLSSFSEGSLSSWNDEFFNFIVGSCAAMKEFSREIDENIVALGINDNHHDTANFPATVTPVPRWEVDGWRSIQDLTKSVEDMTNGFATRYLQYVTIQEAHVSNANAQSLSRITVLTMLFIPLSTVASIFSMGGDFLPGQSRMWVFWVSVIPVLVIVSYLYWQRQLVNIWRCRRMKLLPLFDLGPAKSK